MTTERRPTLCVIAGPNGFGKTTTTQLLLANEWGADSLYINPDNIAQEKFGDWNNQDAILKAAKQATDIRYKCLEEKRSFVFETVFSSPEKLDFLKKSKVISRYFKSLENAKKAITFIDRAYIYDNSADNQLPQLLYRTTDGQIAKKYVDNIPEWAQLLFEQESVS